MQQTASSLSPSPQSPSAPLWRCACSIAYECVLLFGVYWIAGYLYLTLTRQTFPLASPHTHFFAAYIAVVFAIYFGYFWSHGGQTVAMKAWDVRLETIDGQRVSWVRAMARYAISWGAAVLAAAVLTWGLQQLSDPAARSVVALLFPLVLGCIVTAAFLQARLGRSGQFLHDQWLGLRLVSAPPKRKTARAAASESTEIRAPK
jgi:uncharacterized RDD family membrane protein YckC